MNGVRFVNPQLQYKNQRDEILKTVDDVLSRGDLIMRKDLDEFETAIAQYVGVKHAIGLKSGTDALSMSVEAAGIKQGDEVITVGHTFLASISSICHSNATPILVDVNDDFLMDASLLEAHITPKTKAIMPVHLNGRICDMDAIMEIAAKHNLVVIEDAAQALGATYKMKDGTVKMAGSFGIAGCFSMYPFKSLGAFGDAGVLTTNNDELALMVRRMRYNGEDRTDRKFYHHGYTALLDNLQAALLNVKFKHFPAWVVRRREIASRYEQGLKGIAGLTLPNYHDDDIRYDSFQNYVIRSTQRDALREHLKSMNVETLVSWATPMYKEPVMMPNTITLPRTEKICTEVISLPMYPELTNEEVDYVIGAVRGFYKV